MQFILHSLVLMSAIVLSNKITYNVNISKHGFSQSSLSNSLVIFLFLK